MVLKQVGVFSRQPIRSLVSDSDVESGWCYCAVKATRLCLGGLVSLIVMSCAGAISPSTERQPYLVGEALKLEPSPTHQALRSLPPPAGKVETAVYRFEDLTGQKKNPPNSSTFSSAVTQGAETILMKALLDSGWFNPRERKGLQNVLTEREILQKSINERAAGNTQKLKTLTPANIIIEGGVIGFESNIRSGGVGAKYLGIGGSKRYQEDLVSVNLRAVNVVDGSILLSVNSFKSIYSEIKDRGIFAYVDYNKILELESGYAYNESVQLALTEAIETAVLQLIADGVAKLLWLPKSKKDTDHPSFQKFGEPALWQTFLKSLEPVTEEGAEMIEDLSLN